MDYAEILKRAAQIVWRYKFLWALGFLVALGSGGGSGGGNNSGWRESFDPGSQAAVEMERAAAHLEQFWAAYAGAFIGLLCLGLLVGLVFWLVKLVAEAGLVDAVNKIEDGQKASFAQAMSGGAAALLRMIGLKIILALPIFLIVGLIGLLGVGLFGGTIAAAVSESSAGVGAMLGALGLFLACLIPLLCVIFILAIVIFFIDLFAVRGIVIRNLGVVAALQHSWSVIRGNLLEVILLGLILLVIGFLFSLAVGAALLPLGFLFAAPTIFSLLANDSVSFGAVATTGVGLICLGIAAAVLNSIWIAYQSTAYTLAYRYFIGGKAKFIND
jgi:hypothetical protein